ncbi:hypothetical protein ZWY2020_053976 [Hordeum vulgare]|nr:hypothetical protein ZWY2020_053971 [Hordeum vulgare]KAI4998634.1 hypothetical protein ZWY2020_053976 [Hordeum vulgare]
MSHLQTRTGMTEEEEEEMEEEDEGEGDGKHEHGCRGPMCCFVGIVGSSSLHMEANFLSLPLLIQNLTGPFIFSAEAD